MANSKSSNSNPSRRGPRSSVMRRPPEKGLPKLRHRVRLAWFGLLEQPVVWVLFFLLVGIWTLLPQRVFFVPRLVAGDIASKTWIADRDIQVENEAATLQLRERASQEVLPIYDRDRSQQAAVRRDLADLFAAGREMAEAGELAEGEEEPQDSRSSNRARRGSDPGSDDAEGSEEGESGESLIDSQLRLLGEASAFRISAEALELLIQDGFSTQLEDRLGGVLARVMRQGVVADKEVLLEHRVRGITVRSLPSGQEGKELDLFRFLDYPEQVREEIENDLRGWDGVRSRERTLWGDLLLANITPNLNYNSSDTLERRRRAAEAEGSVTHTFGNGEVIVRRGARVDELRAQALDQLAGEQELGSIAVSALGATLLLGAATLLLWLAVGQERRTDRGPRQMLGEVLILLTLALLSVRFGIFVAEALAGALEREPLGRSASYRLAVPFAANALICVLLYGRNLALVSTLVFALLSGRIAGGGDGMWEMVVYVLASSLAAVFALDHTHFRQRSMMTRAAFVVAGVNAAAVLTVRTMSDSGLGTLSQLGFDLLCGFAGGLLAAAITSFAVPILEPLFHITTSIKLVELANPNLPLLRRLAFEAPGTFQHSLAVANLSKAGVEAIEGDSVLVHTGALYHDIGKIIRPHYFIENQPPGQNPHDRIQPSMSALILINHVKEGLELAEKHALPTPIIDAIEQHHGTRLIKFFYNRAKERRDPDTDEVREEEFRYPGPKPEGKEMGVLMLADAVEAASRTLVEPSRQKIRAVIRAVFDDCLHDGQLDRTSLTLGDLKRVEEAFLRILTNIHHKRIDYPGFDFNRKTDGRSEAKGEARAEGTGEGAAESGSDGGDRGRGASERTGSGRSGNGSSEGGSSGGGRSSNGRGRESDSRTDIVRARRAGNTPAAGKIDPAEGIGGTG